MQERQRSDIRPLPNIKEDVRRHHPNYQSSSRILRKLLTAFNISQYELDEYEADDIIGTLSTKGNAEDAEVVVISGDKDLTQLVTDTYNRVDYPKRNYGY